MSADSDPAENIIPEAGSDIVLLNGIEVRVAEMRMRELLMLLRIVTVGGGMLIGSIDLNFDDPEVFASQMQALFLFSMPEAIEETVQFLTAVVRPVSDDPDAKRALLEYMHNPDIDGSVEVITQLVMRDGGMQNFFARLGVLMRSKATLMDHQKPSSPKTKKTK